MFRSSELQRSVASVALQAAFVKAVQTAIAIRKKEDGLTHRTIARTSGRTRSGVSNIVAGRDWEVRTISDLTEALGLRFEFAFVDRKNARRRFTPSGVEYVQAVPSEGSTSCAGLADQHGAQTASRSL